MNGQTKKVIGQDNGRTDEVNVEAMNAFAESMADSLTEELFPKVWDFIKKEQRYKSKKEMAQNMFFAGGAMMLSTFLQLSYEEGVEFEQVSW